MNGKPDICIHYLGNGNCFDGTNCAFRDRANMKERKCKVYGRCGNVNSSSEKRMIAFRKTLVREI